MALKTVLLISILMVMLATMLVLIQLSACGGGSDASKGTLKLSITDRQSDSFAAVVISISEVRVVPAGKENAADDDPGLPVVAHFTTPKVIDVMQFQFAQKTLGNIVLPVGNYRQIRLILEPNPNGQGQQPANYVVLKTSPNSKIPLKTPSAQQSGLKVIGSIEVKPNIINTFMLDFDPNTAIVARGNGDYNLKPTGIRVVRVANGLTEFGSITGTVVSAFKDWSSASVSIKRRGELNDIEPIAAGKIFSNYTSGAWQAPFSAFVPPNTQPTSYKTFISADGFRVYSSSSVNVTQGQATNLRDILLVTLIPLSKTPR